MQIDFPRVTLPGVTVDPEVREALDAFEADRAHVRGQQKGLAGAMVRLGKPIARRPGKRTRPTKHVRRMRALAARSTKGATA